MKKNEIFATNYSQKKLIADYRTRTDYTTHVEVFFLFQFFPHAYLKSVKTEKNQKGQFCTKNLFCFFPEFEILHGEGDEAVEGASNNKL